MVSTSFVQRTRSFIRLEMWRLLARIYYPPPTSRHANRIRTARNHKHTLSPHCHLYVIDFGVGEPIENRVFNKVDYIYFLYLKALLITSELLVDRHSTGRLPSASQVSARSYIRILYSFNTSLLRYYEIILFYCCVTQ